MSEKGNCPKHGEFVLMDGCAQCLADQHKAFIAPVATAPVKGLYERAWDVETEVLAECNKLNANRLSVIYLIRERERILNAVNEN